MDVGVGLPTTVPGVTGPRLVEWARRAEAADFTSLAVLDRLVWDNYEPLVALAAAAAVTERIRLATTILIAAYRADGVALLAKQLATIDHLSGGRLVLGVAAGDRADDFAAAGAATTGRGRRLDRMIGELRRLWAGEETAQFGPRPLGDRVPILVGGHSPQAMRRAARYGQGWIAGGSSATSYPDLVGRLRSAWAEEGRDDRPRLVSLAYVSLGRGGQEAAASYLAPYYAHIGPHRGRVVTGVLTGGPQLREHLARYAEAGCDEMILLPCDSDPEQVDLMAKAVW